MPTVRYQIRNEYGLADPELHRAADKDDPEAILEGVAMAGLVGVLRQLGDLAEFAAEIFRDLHEEVMGTAARGHGLMLRVQQLEAEFPSVEKAIFSQSSHSSFAYNDGIDCHSNIQMDQNLITQGDMPRFILDSYEECRGPPRLFTLDKFDTAGAGACLKRYSDPSFFKMELVSSGLMETEIPREKKSRKTRSKAPRWKTGRTLESLLSPHSNSNLQPISDQVSGNSATRLVRLKSRNLNDSNGSKGDNLRKRLLELHSDEQKVVFDNSRSHSNIDVDSIYSSGQTSLMHDTVMDISVNHALVRDASPTMIPSKVATRLTIYEKDHGKIEGKEFSEALNEPFAEVQNPQRNFNPFGSKEKFTDSGNKSEGSAYDYELSDTEKNTSLQVIHHKLVGVELKLEGNTDGYRTEDIGSEQENFMDALNSMESELETDSENKGRPDLGILRREAHEMNSDTSERLEELLQTEISELDFAEVSSVSIGLNNILKSGISSNLSKLVETPSTEEKAVTSNSFANAEFFLGSMHNESCQELLPDEVANSANLISDGASNMKTFYNPSFRSEIREESCNSCVTNLTSNLLNSDPQERFDALKFVTVYQSDTSAGHEAQLGTHEIDNDGLPHFNRSFPEKPPPAEHVEEAILEDMTEMLDMPNHQREHVEEQNQRDMTDNHPADHVEEPMSSSPTGSASMVDPDNKDSLFMIVPPMQEMQDSINKETEAFASKKDTTASSSRRSILTAIPDFVPDTSMDFVQHELAAEVDNVKYPEASTIETSSDYVEGTDDAAQNMNDPSVGSNDNISENPHLACNPVERISEEMAFRPDLSDYLSETEHENGLVKDFAGYIEVPLHPSKVTMGESPQSTNQEAKVNSTETISPPVPVITTSSDKDFTAEMEDIVAVENLEVGFENVDNMAGSNLALPEILQPQLEYFSDTEESQESPRVNSTEEPKDPPKVNSAEQVPLCSESETFSDRVMNSPMLVGANFTLPNEFNQDNPQKNVQGFEQIIDVNNLSAENFASEDTTTRSLLYTQEASGLQLQLIEDSTPDAAVSYLHQLKVHETCSPKTVEASDSQSTLNMALSSVAEQSALDPADICSGLPVKDPSENDARLLGEVCDIMPAGHLQSYLHPCVDETCLECPVQSEQDFGSKCLVQGHHENAKQEMSLSTNLFSDPASLPEEASTLQASDEVKEVDSLYQKGELLELDISTNSIDIDDNTSEGPETNYHDFVGNVEYHELDVPPSNTDETEKLGSDLVSSECSSEISACHMASNVSDMTFSLLSSSDVVVTESSSKLPYEPHSDEPASSIPSQNSEEPPPLPPLPPLEWRSRKLQLHSLLPNENSSQSLAGTNPFMALSANSCMAPSFSSSELLPILVDPSHQYDALSPEGSIVHSSNASSLISSSIEHEKSLYAPDAQKGLKLPLADSLTPCPILESQSSHHFTLQEERIQPLLDERFQTSQLWPSLDLETSHYSEHRHLTLEKEMTQPQNPLLVKSTLEDEIHHHNYGGFRGQNVHVLKSLELSLSSGLEMPQPRYVYSLEGSHSTIFGVVPTIEDEWFSIKHCSIRNRPRNPLIEAVVAHDRSTLRKVPELAKPSNESKADKKDALLESNILQLRKVSELVKPSNKPKTDERDALLEQIRNKSFSLKPAAVSRPNNKGHSTNIKVAAILERANALRQAMAGSDEEDGGDNWSDC